MVREKSDVARLQNSLSVSSRYALDYLYTYSTGNKHLTGAVPQSASYVASFLCDRLVTKFSLTSLQVYEACDVFMSHIFSCVRTQEKMDGQKLCFVRSMDKNSARSTDKNSVLGGGVPLLLLLTKNTAH